MSPAAATAIAPPTPGTITGRPVPRLSPPSPSSFSSFLPQAQTVPSARAASACSAPAAMLTTFDKSTTGRGVVSGPGAGPLTGPVRGGVP